MVPLLTARLSDLTCSHLATGELLTENRKRTARSSYFCFVLPAPGLSRVSQKPKTRCGQQQRLTARAEHTHHIVLRLRPHWTLAPGHGGAGAQVHAGAEPKRAGNTEQLQERAQKEGSHRE